MNIAHHFKTPFPEPLLFNTGLNVSHRNSVVEIYDTIASLSSGLYDCDVRIGDRVLILAGNYLETYVFTLALWNIGAVAVPLSPSMGKNILARIIADTEPSVCFYVGNLSPDLRGLLSKCALFVRLGAEGIMPNDTMRTITYKNLSNHNAVIEPGDFPASQPALIIHSSGSQGIPKAIQFGHQSLFNYFHFHDIVHRQFAEHPALNIPQVPFISVFQPSHLAAYSITLQALLMRRPTYLMSSFIPADYLRLLSTLECRLAILVPSMYVALLKSSIELKKAEFPNLALCGCVGEPVSETLIKKVELAFNARVFIGYGLSECLPGIGHSWEELQRADFEVGSCGKKIFEEVKLVDKNGEECNAGELWVRNPTVNRCYVDDNLNSKKFTADGWLKTGDLLIRDNFGNYFHKGRIDDMFVSNGKNIYPAEIEGILSKHPAVENVIAAAIHARDDTLIPAALVQINRDVDEAELIEFYLSRGPLHATPKRIKTIDTLPELGPGKVDRKSCQHMLQIHINQNG